MAFSPVTPLHSSFAGNCVHFISEFKPSPAIRRNKAPSSCLFSSTRDVTRNPQASIFSPEMREFEVLDSIFNSSLQEASSSHGFESLAGKPLPRKVRRARPPLSKEGHEGQMLSNQSSSSKSSSRLKRKELPIPLHERLKASELKQESSVKESTPPSIGSRSGRLTVSEWETLAREKLKDLRKQSNEAAKDRMSNSSSITKSAVDIRRKIGFAQYSATPVKAVAPVPGLMDANPTVVDSSEVDFDDISDAIEDVDGAVVVDRQERLFDELGMSRKERILGRYILSLGFSKTEFMKLADKRLQAFLTNLHAAKARVSYLCSLGVKAKDVPKLLLRHPQLLEYSIERTMQPRVEYLMSLGVCKTKLGKIITKVPTLLEYRVEECLKPRVKYLQDTVGISESNLPLVLQRSPQILTQSIENSLEPKLHFLLSLGIDLEDVARMVTRHPQLLHYSVDDNMKPRVEFLRSIGMPDAHIVRTLVRLSQILSLSVESNLTPKYEYLTKELGGDASTVARFPAYFSLSLEQRIKPRHLFLVLKNKLPAGPLPMKFLSIGDVEFCRIVQCPLQEYVEFKQNMLLDSLSKKFGTVKDASKKRTVAK